MKSILMLANTVFTKGLLALHLPVEIASTVALNPEQVKLLKNVVGLGHSRLSVPGFLFIAQGGEEGLPSELTVYAVNGGNELRLGSLEGEEELDVLNCVLSTWLADHDSLPSHVRVSALQLGDGNDNSLWIHSKLCDTKVPAYLGMGDLILDRGSDFAGFPARRPVSIPVGEWVTQRIVNRN